MNFPTEIEKQPPLHDVLTKYLHRGNYELLGAPHSSYETICESILAEDYSTIAIDGPTTAGKTSMTSALVNFLEYHQVPIATIPLDIFLTDRVVRSSITQSANEGYLDIADYSSLAWEQDRYHENIALAKEIAEQTSEPFTLVIPNAYNRSTGRKDQRLQVTIQPGSLIITEGVGVQTYHSELFDLTVRVDTRENDTLFKRVLQREQQKPSEARLSEDFLRERYNVIDAPHTDFLRLNSPSADFVVDTSNFQEMLLYKHL